MHCYDVSPECRVDQSHLLESTRQALEHYDEAYVSNRYFYFTQLEGRIRTHDGVPYAFIKDRGDSSEEVVVFHNPWATPITPDQPAETACAYVESDDPRGKKPFDSNRWNKLIFADFVHKVIRNAGITDSSGNYLPVVAIASPSLGRRGISKKWGGAKIAEDPMYGLAETTLDVVERHDFGKLHMAGVSLGAAVIGHVLLSNALRNFEVQSATLCEYPSLQKRNLVDYAKRYVFDTKGLDIDGDWTDEGPLPRAEIAQNGESYDIRNVIGNRNCYLNLKLAASLRRNSFDSLKGALLNHRVPTTLEYGTKSKISQGFDAQLAADPDLHLLDGVGLLQVIEAYNNAPHAHTENSVLVSDVVSRSLQFAREAY